MGLYLDKPEDKLAWLRKHASSFTPGELDQYIAGTKLLSNQVPLALMFNGWGPTVAILFSRPEAKRFRQGRTDAEFFICDRDAVKEYLK